MSLKGTPTWRFHSKLYKFGLNEYLAYELSHRPDSWRGFLYIYLLLFPRFWTFRILGLQPRDKAAILRVKTIEFFLEEFT